MANVYRTKRLDGKLEICLEIFYCFAIVLGYNFIRPIIKEEYSLSQIFNEAGSIIFLILFVFGLIFLAIAASIMFYIKHAEENLYYNLRAKWIIIISLPIVVIFELFLIK